MELWPASYLGRKNRPIHLIAMAYSMFSPELEAEDKRHMTISGIITATVMVLLILLSLVWTAYRLRLPPPGEKSYEVVGAIDFGNYTNGSRKVNNFQKPVEKPVETPPPPAQAKPTPAKPQPTPPVVTTNTPSPVTVQPKPVPVPPKPAETKPTPAQPTPTPPKPNTQPSPTYSPTTPNKPTQSGQSGSNEGDATSGTGNQGTPNTKTLDPNGLYSFGTGSGGGLNGRTPLSLDSPVYNSQSEARITFTFVIQPDGSVSSVNAVTDKLDLKRAGIDAIKKWRFSKVDASNGPQTVRVTITFKLKG